ncbi:zinc-finger domain-containing protein [uncultured Thiohalocapsa sp.]|uniref:zinc-finger domain-containing protein n=1 Tax=uncultured Thiohalocapsa sp. TaxID=768990 RepID=UPI0025D5730D|nr:zinc-finger domain-containing protein [uncultured Thiohalocapsa sp.]
MLKSRRERPAKPASPPPAAEPSVRVVTRKDLPLSCPMPDAPVWNMHPRVYLPIEDDPSHEATCPYCGAQYRLSDD